MTPDSALSEQRLALYIKVRTGKALSVSEWNLTRKALNALHHPLLPKNNFLSLIIKRNSSEKPILWKEPNTHFFLETLVRKYPNFKYLHLIRDGRAMAHSKNDQQFQKIHPDLMSLPEQLLQLAKLDFWIEKNEHILHLEKKHSRQICVIRFEDLIHHPKKTAQLLSEFLTLPMSFPILSNIESQTDPTKIRNIDFQKLDLTRLKRMYALGYE